MFDTRLPADFHLKVMLIESPQIHNREDIITAFLTGASRPHMTRNYSHSESKRARHALSFFRTVRAASGRANIFTVQGLEKLRLLESLQYLIS
jgi:hypothetical protein